MVILFEPANLNSVNNRQKNLDVTSCQTDTKMLTQKKELSEGRNSERYKDDSTFLKNCCIVVRLIKYPYITRYVIYGYIKDIY